MSLDSKQCGQLGQGPAEVSRPPLGRDHRKQGHREASWTAEYEGTGGGWIKVLIMNVKSFCDNLTSLAHVLTYAMKK